MSQMNMSWIAKNYRKLSGREATDKILERAHNREIYFALLIKICQVARERGLRLVFENPYSLQTFLRSGFLTPPAIVDVNRRLRGDEFAKPTGYWYINCKPTNGESWQPKVARRVKKDCKGSKQTGLCNEERSMISPDYARNFTDIILIISNL